MAGLNVDTLTAGLTSSLGQALAQSGKDLSGDVQNFILPELRDLAKELVLIASRVEPDGLSEDDAKTLAAQEITHTVNTVSMAVAELTALEVDHLIKAAIAGVSALVNGALGFALL